MIVVTAHDAKGHALDAAVAVARNMVQCLAYGRGSVTAPGLALDLPHGTKVYVLRNWWEHWIRQCDDDPWGPRQDIWQPSRSWAQCGELLDELTAGGATALLATTPDGCQATVTKGPHVWSQTGDTPQIAIARCYVAVRCGLSVAVRDDLLRVPGSEGPSTSAGR